MTAYVVIADSEIDPDSPITTALMTKMRDNPIAISEGSAGAPNIVQAALAVDSVGQAELKDAETNHTAAGSISWSSSQATTGGMFTLGSKTKVTGTGASPTGKGLYQANVTTSTFASELLLSGTNSSGTNTTEMTERYFTASPPYDLGDGDVALFVFALMERSSAEIVATCVSIDPPWAHNGPTIITPERFEGARAFRRVRRRTVSARQAAANPAKRAIFRSESKQALVEIEITQAIKQADMPLIPHPFIMWNDAPIDPAVHSVILLDTVGSFIEELAQLHEEFRASNTESVSNLLHDGLIIVDNKPLSRSGPPNVPVIKARWKLTP